MKTWQLPKNLHIAANMHSNFTGLAFQNANKRWRYNLWLWGVQEKRALGIKILYDLKFVRFFKDNKNQLSLTSINRLFPRFAQLFGWFYRKIIVAFVIRGCS